MTTRKKPNRAFSTLMVKRYFESARKGLPICCG